uniref:Uncharacterized protein n=1 Tax=Zea mays TaxID=4577 RepID=C4J451_MAIZE|nr:unknown [Zea mays]
MGPFFGLVTAPLLGKVRVVGLGGDASVPLDVLERVVHEAAVAALVVHVVAVHELLLRQGHQLPGHDLVDALHGRDGRERPAAPALALVLDAGDRAAEPPVDRGRQVRRPAPAPAMLRVREAPRLAQLGAVVARPGASVRAPELVRGHVRELVQRQPERPAVLPVRLVDVPRVLLEHVEPARLLLLVVPVPRRHPVVVAAPPLVQRSQALLRRQVPLAERDAPRRRSQCERGEQHRSQHQAPRHCAVCE